MGRTGGRFSENIGGVELESGISGRCVGVFSRGVLGGLGDLGGFGAETGHSVKNLKNYRKRMLDAFAVVA